MTKSQKLLFSVFEAVYRGNFGYEEMVKFYQVASKSEMDKMGKILKNSDFEEFKVLIKEVLGVKLV